MRTSNMIYQAAVAHQTDLRRTAAEHSRNSELQRDRAPWRHLVSSIVARRARSGSAAAPVASAIAMRQLSA